MSRWTRFAFACLLVSGCRSAGTAGDTETTGAETSGSSGGTGDETGGSETGDDEPVPAEEPWAARLTDTQYAYTVQDVFGVELTDSERGELPADIPTGRDYSTAVPTQSFTSQYVMAYAEVSRSLTDRIDIDALLSNHGHCGDPTDEECLDGFVRGLGLRLFRRPLTDGEASRLLDLAAAIEAGEFSSNADVLPGLVQAMMQMPQFVYRVERETDGEPGELRALDGYELATRLSYFLWQSAPDPELLDFAAGPEGDGAYDDAALAEQIERMLADPKFARSREMFWGDYTMASRSAFGTSDLELAAELRDSLMLTLDRLSGADGNPRPLSDLFDGEELVMTPAVATLAGIEFPVGGAAIYDVEETQQRLGIATHPGFLASIGTTSFVGRGLFLSERLLCQEIAEPPENAAEQIEDTAEATENMTPREASEFRFALDPVCQVCHLQFEPIAYAFERYDITGGYTRRDENGRDLFSDGVLPVFDDRPEIAFEDAQQLLAELAPLPSTQRCFVYNMSEFGFGRAPLSNEAWLDDATDTFTDQGTNFDALVRVIALSDKLAHLKVVEPG